MNTKKDFYLYVYNYIRDHNKLPKGTITKQSLNYYVSRLKKDDLIRKIGYGVWEINKVKEVKKLPKDYERPLYKGNIRGHAFILTFKIPKLANWHNMNLYLEKNNVHYKKIGIGGKTLSIEFKGHRVWIAKSSIVIYSKKSYYDTSASGTYIQALNDLLSIFYKLETFFKVSLKINKKYKFKVSRHHQGKINDSLAKHCNDNKYNIRVSDRSGEWFIIDNSLNLNESETVHSHSATRDMDEIVIPHFNDLKNYFEKNGEALKLSQLVEITKSIIKIQQQSVLLQEMNQEQIKNILKAIEKNIIN